MKWFFSHPYSSGSCFQLQPWHGHRASSEWSSKLIQSDKEAKCGAEMKAREQKSVLNVDTEETRTMKELRYVPEPVEIRLCGLTPWNHRDLFLLTPAHRARPEVHTHVDVMNDPNLTLTKGNTLCKYIITEGLHSQPQCLPPALNLSVVIQLWIRRVCLRILLAERIWILRRLIRGVTSRWIFSCNSQ